MGGGVSMDYSIYKHSPNIVVKISGKLSYYLGSNNQRCYPYLRIYSTASGIYRYYSFESFTNSSGNHFTIPIEIVLSYSDLPESGWFHMYWYNHSGCYTDGNDQLWIHTTMYSSPYLS